MLKTSNTLSEKKNKDFLKQVTVQPGGQAKMSWSRVVGHVGSRPSPTKRRRAKKIEQTLYERAKRYPRGWRGDSPRMHGHTALAFLMPSVWLPWQSHTRRNIKACVRSSKLPT